MKSVDDLSKDELADLAAALFNWQLLGATTIVELVEKFPWLLERAPQRWEAEAIVALARRGSTVLFKDDQYWIDCVRFRKEYEPGDTSSQNGAKES